MLDHELSPIRSSSSSSSSSSTVVYIEQFYFPEGWNGADIPKAITTFLASNRFNVSVLCGTEPYVQPSPEEYANDPRLYNVNILPIFTFRSNSFLLSRIINNFIFSVQSFFKLLIFRRLDLIFVQTNPPLSLLAAFLISLYVGTNDYSCYGRLP